MPCAATEPPRFVGAGSAAARFALLAGHLSFAGVQRWAYASSRKHGPRVPQPRAGVVAPRAASLGGGARTFRCLASFRPSVPRVRACWDDRLASRTAAPAGGGDGGGGGGGDGGGGGGGAGVEEAASGRIAATSELTGAEASRLLAGMRDAVGEGCNNEGLRVFSPVGNDEEQVNGLTETDPAAAALLKGYAP